MFRIGVPHTHAHSTRAVPPSDVIYMDGCPLRRDLRAVVHEKHVKWCVMVRLERLLDRLADPSWLVAKGAAPQACEIDTDTGAGLRLRRLAPCGKERRVVCRAEQY